MSPLFPVNPNFLYFVATRVFSVQQTDNILCFLTRFLHTSAITHLIPGLPELNPWAGIFEHLRCWILPYCRPICFLTVRFEETDAFTLVVEGIGEIEVPPTIILALVYVPYWPT